MKLKIIKDSNPIMREKSQEVPMPLSVEDKTLLDDMLQHLKNSQDEEYLKKHKDVRPGVGLAAIQLGIAKRMFVVYYEKGDSIVQYQIVNPKIIETSVRKCALEGGEGCLSVTDEHDGLVHRYFKIVMKAYDALRDKDITITAKGYDAIVLQHEYDHLDGKFFYDRIDKNNKFKQLDNEVLI
jgi:peptide deformylase